MLARLVAVSGAHDLISFAEDKVINLGLNFMKVSVLGHLSQLTDFFANKKIFLMTRDERIFIPDKKDNFSKKDDIYMIADRIILKRKLSVFGEKNSLF
ncbi:MAG: hypothetical protein CM15mP124_7530 [Alphaproteobacteria bacterium]|nr:MAG: hypothetical protein CM15mP124_7530 [Alphaproteobacteria bacterium]